MRANVWTWSVYQAFHTKQLAKARDRFMNSWQNQDQLNNLEGNHTLLSPVTLQGLGNLSNVVRGIKQGIFATIKNL